MILLTMSFYFSSLAEFIAMGKHGVYVWACWGIVWAVMLGLVVYSVQQRKTLIKQFKRQQAQQRK